MKYTRYDMGKRKKESFIFVIIMILILLLAFIIGTIIFNIFIKNHTSLNVQSKNIKNSNNIINNSKVEKFIAIQGGIYSNKENAEKQKNILNQFGNPFIIKEGNKSRVFVGIYGEKKGKEMLKNLTNKKIDNSNIIFTVNKNNLCDSEIVQMINANIDILTKLSEKNVKFIETNELKKWCSSLKEVDKNNKNISILKELKSYINHMPKELYKDKVEGNYIYIYNLLKKISSK